MVPDWDIAKTTKYVPIRLHAVWMLHTNYGINKVNLDFSVDILVNTKKLNC